jgi:hypothetical protein
MRMGINFGDLELGAAFIFSAETMLGWPGARGPWIKVSARRYVDATNPSGDPILVGTVKAAVIEQPQQPGRRVEDFKPGDMFAGRYLIACRPYDTQSVMLTVAEYQDGENPAEVRAAIGALCDGITPEQAREALRAAGVIK